MKLFYENINKDHSHLYILTHPYWWYNITPIENAQFGNPTIGAKTVTTFNNLEDAAHSSKYGAFNKPNVKGTGLQPDLLGNSPQFPEIDFTNYRP